MRIDLLTGSIFLAIATNAHATIVSMDASMTVDNSFTAYVSTDPTLNGDQFLTGGSWPTTYSGSYDFDTAGTYYLHVYAHDAGSPEMFIGLFNLTNENATFSNGTQRLITDASDNWAASITGFGGDDVGLSDRGANGTAPWGFYAAMEDARFIWADSARDDIYFTTIITVVPSPSTLGALGLCGLVCSRRRRA